MSDMKTTPMNIHYEKFDIFREISKVMNAAINHHYRITFYIIHPLVFCMMLHDETNERNSDWKN